MFGDSRRDVTVTLRAEVLSYIGQMKAAGAETRKAAREAEGFDRSSAKMGNQIDRLSGRMRIYTDLAATMGPALIPVAAIGIPALAGLAAQAGFAAIAGGTLVASFQGVGEALKAMNKAHLEPTAENLAAARTAMADISPEARALVVQLREVVPELKNLRDAGAEGFFPGLGEGIDSMESRLPALERIISAVSGELGDIASDTGASLASDRWDDFFTFLATDAPSALADMARATGNVAHAATEMWMNLDPSNDEFSAWLVGQTNRLDDWATGLDQTDGFREFMQYIEDTGPQVGETLGSIANGALQIVEATAPLAGPALQGLEAVADVIATIADSDLGTPIFAGLAALALYNRALAVTDGLSKRAFISGETGIKAQVAGLRSMPAAYKEAQSAQRGLVAAQREADAVTSRYVGQLQAANSVTARGIPTSMRSFDRLADSLSQVEMANYSVTEATAKASKAEAERSRITRAGMATIGKSAALAGGLALAGSGAAGSIGLTNTASLALMGTLAGPWGAAVGGAVGLLMDARTAAKGYEDALDGLNESASSGTGLKSLVSDLRDFQAASKDMYNITSLGDLFGDIQSQMGAVFSGDIGASQARDNAVIAERTRLLAQLIPAYDLLAVKMGAFKADGKTSYGQKDIIEFADKLGPAMARLGVTNEELSKMDGAELEVLAGRLREAASAADTTAGRTLSLKTAMQDLDNEILTTADTSTKFASALQALLGPGLNAEAATDNYTQSIRDLGKALRDNGGDFDGNSKAAMANRAASREWMGSFTEMLTKQAEAGASSGKIAQQVEGARAAFIREGQAAGLSAGEIRRRLRVMGLTPKLVRTVFNAAGLEVVSAKVARLNRQYQGLPKRVRVAIAATGIPKTEGDLSRLDRKVGGLTKQQRKIIAKLMDQTPATQAKILRNLKKVDNAKPKAKATLDDKISSKIPGIQAKIDSLHGKTIVVTTEHRTKKASAYGNIFPGARAYAQGDIANRHQAELAGPGDVRIWREPETQGEAYIPLANDDRRPRARSIAESTVAILGGSVSWYGMGGLASRYAAGGFATHGGGQSVQVLFPAPAVLKAAVEAANQIAVDAAYTARSAAETRTTHLEDLRAQQRIRDLTLDLRRKETVKVKGRDGRDDNKSKKGMQDTTKNITRLAVRGLDRTIAQAELADARLAQIESRAQIRADAIAALNEKINATTTTLSGTGDIFARGTSPTAAITSVNRTVADITNYGNVVARLKAAKASPALLAQLVAKAETGDFRSAIRLGEALLASPVALGQLNASLGTLGQVSSGVAHMTTDPRFSSNAAWNPTNLVSKTVNFQLSADPSTWTADIARRAAHIVMTEMGGN